MLCTRLQDWVKSKTKATSLGNQIAASVFVHVDPLGNSDSQSAAKEVFVIVKFCLQDTVPQRPCIVTRDGKDIFYVRAPKPETVWANGTEDVLGDIFPYDAPQFSADNELEQFEVE